MPAKKNPDQQLTRRQQMELLVRKRIKRTILISASAAVLFIGIVALIYFMPKAGSNPAKQAQSTAPAVTVSADQTAAVGETASAITKNSDYARADDPIATITLADGSAITIELYPAAAPNTVANFIELANSGFYDGLTFHRVIKGFMIQGGDPQGDGTGGPDYTIKGEFTKNGVDNKLTHTPGVISMARTDAGYDTAGSQFFIVQGDATSLDGQYAAFGEVTGGMDVVNSIADVEVDASDKPVQGVVIQSIDRMLILQ